MAEQSQAQFLASLVPVLMPPFWQIISISSQGVGFWQLIPSYNVAEQSHLQLFQTLVPVIIPLFSQIISALLHGVSMWHKSP